MIQANTALEKTIEQKFYKECGKRGWLCYKFDVSPHLPDRIILCPGGHVFFIEFKRPGEKPRKGQLICLETLANLGFKANWFDNWRVAIKWISDSINEKQSNS